MCSGSPSEVDIIQAESNHIIQVEGNHELCRWIYISLLLFIFGLKLSYSFLELSVNIVLYRL